MFAPVAAWFLYAIDNMGPFRADRNRYRRFEPSGFEAMLDDLI